MGVDRLFASRDESWVPRSRKRATFWLIGICAGVFFILALVKGALTPEAKSSMDQVLRNWFLVSDGGLLSGRIWQLLTYQLLHGDAWHLVWNMLVLFFVGTLFEDLFGSKNLVWAFFLCGAFAGLACFLEALPVLGASGSILALLIVLVVRIPNQQVMLLFFPIRMKWVGVIIVSFEVIQLLAKRGPGDGVANWTHLAGAFSGFCYAWMWPRLLGPRIAAASARRRRRREVAAMEKSLEVERELDRILDKISQVGMNNLSDAERRFLARTSRKLHDSRRS